MNFPSPRLVALLGVCKLFACAAVDGGAIESSWVINAAFGKGSRISCDCARIGAMRYVLRSIQDASDPCEAEPSCEFDCEGRLGLTDFVIPQGQYELSLQPIGLDGQPVGANDGVVGPAQITRSIRFGETAGLGVYLFVAEFKRLAGVPICREEWLVDGR